MDQLFVWSDPLNFGLAYKKWWFHCEIYNPHLVVNDIKTALVHNFGPFTLYLAKAQIMLQGVPINFKQLE